MNVALLKGLIALAPAGLLLSGAAVSFIRGRTIWSLLQVVGATCLMAVVLFHICEALRLFPLLGWGSEHSLGHYLDLASAALALTLFPLGYLLGSLTAPRR